MRTLSIFLALVLVGLGVATGQAAATVSVFTVMLTPTATGDPDASGVAMLRIDQDAQQVCYNIVVRNVDQPAEPAPGIGSAHIHVLPGGGIVVDLETQFRVTGTDTYVATGCVSGSADVLAAILAHPEQYYVNVHTVLFPGGAVQGGLGG
jgi:CHRD domain